jgi:hypothetical protein
MSDAEHETSVPSRYVEDRLAQRIRYHEGVNDRLRVIPVDEMQALIGTEQLVYDDLLSGVQSLGATQAMLTAIAAVFREAPEARDRELLRETAYHESAHAVSASRQSIPFEYATAVPSLMGDAQGYVRLRQGFPTEPAWDDAGRLVLERYAVMNLCGPAAQDRLGTGASREVWERHRADATRILLPIRPFLGEAALAAHVAALEHRARAIVALDWPSISLLAFELMVRDRVSEDEVHAIIRHAEGRAS